MRWNKAPVKEAENEILACCGSRSWARGMAALRPLSDESDLLSASDETWRNLSEADWAEAFGSHPKIGESHAQRPAPARSTAWSATEQRGVATADAEIKMALAKANREYERRFGRIFIVCATGKTGPEILQILERRLQNDDRTELHEAAEEQRQIARLRLKRWING